MSRFYQDVNSVLLVITIIGNRKKHSLSKSQARENSKTNKEGTTRKQREKQNKAVAKRLKTNNRTREKQKRARGEQKLKKEVMSTERESFVYLKLTHNPSHLTYC